MDLGWWHDLFLLLVQATTPSLQLWGAVAVVLSVALAIGVAMAGDCFRHCGLPHFSDLDRRAGSFSSSFSVLLLMRRCYTPSVVTVANLRPSTCFFLDAMHFSCEGSVANWSMGAPFFSVLQMSHALATAKIIV